MPAISSKVGAFIVLACLLQACSTTPPAEEADTGSSTADVAPRSPSDVPELELNLPQPETCNCTELPETDSTFYERGYHALLDGEYADAMEYFERYQRLESSPRVDLEAGIAIAYVRMLPRSEFYDPRAARTAFRTLREQDAKELGVHDYTRLMRQALVNLLDSQAMTNKARTANVNLKEEVAKLEEALKRLRDLTLNQGGAAP